ncbi:CBS domain-containing protein [Cytobacillus suaedae]|nr:CBS domain-containing protein [Cytobacillus suaedae]
MQSVREIMTSDVEYCTPLDNVYEVAVKMKEHDVGVIPIVDNDKLVGMITDRDLVIRGYAEKHSGSTKVTDVMSDELITIKPDTSVYEASQLMSKHQIRRLPVVEHDKLVGIVALGDLATNKLSDQKAGQALSEISENETMHH